MLPAFSYVRPRTLAEMVGQDRLRENLEILIQAAHFRPELDPSHAELTLETLCQIVVQALVFRCGQLKICRNIHRIRGGMALGEKG